MKKILILIISITTLFACSKNDDDTDGVQTQPRDLNGGYVIVEGTSNNYTKAYIKDSTIYFLGKLDSYESRALYSNEYETVSETEIKFYTLSYSVAWDGDKLTLSEIDGTHKYVFISESSTPTPKEWITPIVPVSKINQSTFADSRINDMAYYNGFVYTDGHRDLNEDYVITKINLTDFSMTHIPVPNGSRTTLGYEDNIEYVGSNKFWVYEWGNPDDRMYEFNATTLEQTNSILMPNQFGNVYQLGSNDSDLYGSFYGDIRKWNFVDQKWDNAIEFGYNNPVDGLDLDNDYMYIGKRGIIHKYSLNPLKAVAAYDISKDNKYRLNGFTLTFGNQIVASVYNTVTTEDEIVTITLP